MQISNYLFQLLINHLVTGTIWLKYMGTLFHSFSFLRFSFVIYWIILTNMWELHVYYLQDYNIF